MVHGLARVVMDWPELDRHQQTILLRCEGGTDLTRERAKAFEHVCVADQWPVSIPGDHDARTATRFLELDLEPVTRFALVQSRLESTPEQELEPRSVKLAVWPTLFHENRHSALVRIGSKLPTDGTHDGSKRNVVTAEDGQQCCRVAQPVGDELIQRLDVPRSHRSEVRIHPRLERYAVVVHECQHTLDGAERVSEIVTQMAETVA